MTALISAAHNGEVDEVKRLVGKKQLDVNYADEVG
jgi:hypothetical protein